MEKLYKSRALVLFRRVYKEADEILGLLTPEYGRLDVVVRGSKKLNSSLVGKLEPFVEIRGLLARGQVFSYLVQAEVVRSFVGLRNDYERLCWGAFLLEIWSASATSAELGDCVVDFWSEIQGYKVLYEGLLQSLALMEQARSLRLAGCWAEWNLLRTLGHELFTEGCVSCGAKDVAGVSFAEGGLLCARCLGGENDGSGRDVQTLSARLLAMVRHLPRLSAAKAGTVELEAGEARRLEAVVWRHWRACGLPVVKARHLLDNMS